MSASSPPTTAAWAATYQANANNEDRYVAVDQLPLLTGGDDGPALYAVFDGHGGTACAEYAADQLLPVFCAEWSRSGRPEEALEATFDALDQGFRTQFPRSLTTGACALCACVQDRFIHVAYAGDCRALLIPADGRCAATTTFA